MKGSGDSFDSILKNMATAPQITPLNKSVCKYPTLLVSYEVSHDLLGAIKARVAQALPSDNMTDAVKTVTAVVLAVLAVSTVGAAHLAPMADKRNALITVIFTPGSRSQSHSAGKYYCGSY